MFGCNALLWENDIGQDVRYWTFTNWATWQANKPATTIPDSYIPDAGLQALGHNRRRRGSAVASVRESLRQEDNE